jgi:hypothetical protein
MKYEVVSFCEGQQMIVLSMFSLKRSKKKQVDGSCRLISMSYSVKLLDILSFRLVTSCYGIVRKVRMSLLV